MLNYFVCLRRIMSAPEKYKNQRSTLTGLSIGTICLSTCALLVGMIAMIYIAIGFGSLYFGSTAFDIANNTQLGYDTSIVDDTIVIGGTSINILDLFSKGLSLIFGFTLFTILTTIFSLVVGIITLVKSSKKNMPDSLFLLNVLSAIFSFLGINIIRTVVVIVGCVYIHQIKD